ncbi:MAG: DUF1622 domain-containing protein [Aureispira sp.]|nr:DUF1622 domain-containing protein [Aureispira sp.]
MNPKNRFAFIAIFLLLASPLFLFGQEPHGHTNAHEEGIVMIALEWIEFIVDIVGIAILLIGFLKGTFIFIKMEIDRLRGDKDYAEIFALRNILGSYIIVSLDFLIVSDIIHSVIKPELYELINLGIIVLLRTAIGFFLGKELNELRHELKKEANDNFEELDKKA